MEIEGRIIDQYDEVHRELGKQTLNIAMYINNLSGQKIQVEAGISDQEKRICLIKFKIEIVRLDDDSTSVKTSQNSSIQGLPVKSKGHNNGFIQVLRNDGLSSRGVSPYARTQNVRKNSVAKSKPNDDQRRNKQKQQVEWSQTDAPIPRSYQQKISKDKGETKSSSKKVSESKGNFLRPPLPPHVQKKQLEKKQNGEQSRDLKIFFYERQIRYKDQELQKANRQIQGQKRLIEQLLKSNRQLTTKPQQSVSKKQVQELKAGLLNAQIKIGELQTINRHYRYRQEELQKAVQRQSKQAQLFRDQLQKQKVRMARVMQKCLQDGDNQLMQVIEDRQFV